MASYYVIRSSGDGEVYIDEYKSKERLVARLNEDLEDGCSPPEYLETVPEKDPVYWGRRGVIIKGAVVVPQSVKTVEAFDIE